MGVVRLIQGLSSDENICHSIMIAGTNRSLLEAINIDVTTHSLGVRRRSYIAFFLMARMFKVEQVDIVHVNNLSLWPDAALGALLSGCRCVETFHGIEDSKLHLSSAKRILYKAVALLTSCKTAVSEEAAELLGALTGIDRASVELIPNGIDTTRFAPPNSPEEKREIREAKGLPVDSVVFGCVAALRPVKNHEGLLEAFAQAAQASSTPAALALVGDGPLALTLKRLAEELGVSEKVIFLGLCSDVPELLRSFDAFVLNSDTEGLSYALLEAMASGLPVIATAVGAGRRLVTQGSEGYLVPPGDVPALTSALKRVLDDAGCMKAMGARARATVKADYGFGAMLDSYRRLYKKLARAS